MYKILLVEDETIISEPISFALRTQSFQVDVANNGEEALKYCSENTYDIILLDIMMPVCNGIEFLRKASLKAKSPDTKVILLTNLAGGKEIDEGLQLGASKSILKAEVTPKFLIDLVHSELGSPA